MLNEYDSLCVKFLRAIDCVESGDMFGWFKKKSPDTEIDSDALSDEQVRTLYIAAQMIKSELMMSGESDDFLRSKFVRGYIVGFFDASLQYKNINPVGFDGFFRAVQKGCLFLFEGNLKLSVEYAPESMALIGDEEFNKGRRAAGTEYFGYMQGTLRVPTGLSKYFFENF
jgi:hypothetical protein